MPRVRAAWLILIVAIAVVAAVSPLRQQVLLQWAMLSQLPRRQPPDVSEQPFGSALRLLAPYQDRCVAFVTQHYPSDPEMLLAAGSLSGDKELLRRAAEGSRTPAAWAAYVDALLQTEPRFERVGASGVDPADSNAVAQEEQRIAESRSPTRLSPEEAAPGLRALDAWHAADPKNGLPPAMTALYLYGLHRDDAVLAQWEAAGRLPEVSNRWQERTRAMTRLLVRMGMPEPEAIAASSAAVIFPSLARVRSCARIAVYEGRLAQMQGRATDAVRWWNATARLGRHMQASADAIIGFLVGVAVEAIGGAPSWQWYQDRASGVPNGPLFQGRYFYGSQHTLYVREEGEAAAAQLRDQLVVGKVQTQLVRRYTEGLTLFGDYYRSDRLLAFGQVTAMLLLLLLVFFAATGTWSRQVADQATGISSAWQGIITVLVLAPVAAIGVAALRAPMNGEMPSTGIPVARIAASLGLSAFAAIALPLLAAAFSRRSAARLRTAWRGNLRRVLPLALALGVILYLGLALAAMSGRARWAQEMTRPGVSEVTWLVRQAGPAWSHPQIPSDSWRAGYPPKQASR
jgi:hypothetical protein